MSELIDNRSHRIRTLKNIIKALHQGTPPEQVKDQLEQIVRQTDASEIAAMETELISEGMSVDEVRSMCNLHAAVLQEVMHEPKKPDILPGHPVDTFHQENIALKQLVELMRGELRKLGQDNLMVLRVEFNELMDVDKHYQRKEYLLFSRLEKHGVTGPSKVMWAKDDEVRKLLKEFDALISKPNVTVEEIRSAIPIVIEPALSEVEGMVFKEENILLPLSLSTLTEEDWAEVWLDSPTYGWCLVEPRRGYEPPAGVSVPPAADISAKHALVFPTGMLTPEQLKGLLGTLPLDLTFVDADDCVRYFSEGPERVFVRSKAIIGRKVQHCHPPSSVHVVEKILSDFRTGSRNVAEFWINYHGRFIHIRYFAVRSEQGHYLGTLEVTQDITALRTLAGERRLLQYD
jgi:uncharacterized protein